MNSTIRQVIFWVVIIGGAILLYRFFHNPSVNQPINLSYSELVERVETKQVTNATIEREKVLGKLTNGSNYTTKLGNEYVAKDLADMMKDNNTMDNWCKRK